MFGQEMLDVSSEKGKHDTQPQTTQQLKGDVFSMNSRFVLWIFYRPKLNIPHEPQKELLPFILYYYKSNVTLHFEKKTKKLIKT